MMTFHRMGCCYELHYPAGLVPLKLEQRDLSSPGHVGRCPELDLKVLQQSLVLSAVGDRSLLSATLESAICRRTVGLAILPREHS
jgi:hypothetical protein